MNLTIIGEELSICKLSSLSGVDFEMPFTFFARTDTERSLVCPTRAVPRDVVDVSNGWKAFRVEGTLDFSLVGILSAITRVLADAHIGIFAVSTYDTDYVLTKSATFPEACKALAEAGYHLN